MDEGIDYEEFLMKTHKIGFGAKLIIKNILKCRFNLKVLIAITADKISIFFLSFSEKIRIKFHMNHLRRKQFA